MARFRFSSVEVQLTATNNGEFFRRHNDNGADEVRSRYLTFVYFFGREPLPFDGGELRIYDTAFHNGEAIPVGGYCDITPRQNQMVFFIADYLHEILPVRCPSGDFCDSRFTVNGWLHR